MRSKKAGPDLLTTAAYAAGFAMAPIDEMSDQALPAMTEEHEVEQASTAVALVAPQSTRNALANSAGQVTGWIRQRVPLLGRGAPA